MKSKLLSSLLILSGMIASADAASLTLSTSQPEIGPYDIASLVLAAEDAENVGGGNDATTYVAPDRAAQGQFFTIPDVSGVGYDYMLTGITVQHVGYTDNPGVTWYNMPIDGVLTCRIVDPQYSGTDDFVLMQDSYTITGNEENALPTPAINTANGTGTWFTVTFDNPISLGVGVPYGFDLGGTAGLFFELSGNSADSYDGGSAYTTGSSGVANNNYANANGDRAFILHFAPVYNPSSPSPANKAKGITAEAPLTLSWNTALSPANPEVSNPDVKVHYLYGNFEYGDPNMVLVDTIDAGSPVSATASYLLDGDLMPQRDKVYQWYIEEGMSDGSGGVLPPGDPNNIVGLTWKYASELSVPDLNPASPTDQIVFAGETATFNANAVNPFTGDSTGLSYQWYMDELILDGETDVILEVADVTLDDEGFYSCIVTLDSNGKTSETRSAQLVTKKMVAHWDFNNNVDDVVNGYDGNLFGDPEYTTGVRETDVALNFDGVDDYVQIPEGMADFKTGLTAMVWAKPTAAGNYSRIFDFGNGAPDDNIFLYRVGTGNDLAFRTTDGIVEGALVSATVLAMDQWQHMVITMDPAGVAILYYNGLPVATGSVTVPNQTIRTLNYIGKSNWADDLFAGQMDDLKLYNYSLSAEEIATAFAEVNGNFCMEKPAYDISDDCRVNIEDFALIATQWLDCGFYPSCY